MKKIICLITIFIILIILPVVVFAVRGGGRASSSHSTSSVKSTSATKSVTGYKTFTPKYNSSNIKTEKVNGEPTRYTSYSSTNMFTPNAWTAMWALQCMHDATEQVSEQDIAKELEERGYTQQEVDEILQEGRLAQEEDKQKKEQIDNAVKWILIIMGTMIAIVIILVVISAIKK